MATLEIVQVGDPVLRAMARPLSREELASAEIQQLIADLRDTMRAAPGVGLAAPQIARSLQLDANRFDIEPQITARVLRRGNRIHELPVKFEPRSRAQRKKIGWRDGVRALEVLFKERLR